MNVYIVVADLWSVGDLVTKDDTLAIMSQFDAGEIRGVFDSLEKANKFKTEMEESANPFKTLRPFKGISPF